MEVTHEVGNEKSRRAVESYVERFGGRASDSDDPDQRRYTVTRAEYRRATRD